MASQRQSFVEERCKTANMSTVPIMCGLERLIQTAPTPELRTYAGLFVAASHVSSRGSDILRSRDLRLAVDALLGQARMKNSDVWVDWAASRKGYVLDDWADIWPLCLAENNLPGVDFTVFGVNETRDTRLHQPGSYADCNKALSLLLQCPEVGLDANEACTYTVHNFKHFQIACVLQLMPSATSVHEDMGHWSVNSSMPRRYNSAACSRELIGRATVVDAIRKGWTPAGMGELPKAVPSNYGA